MIASLLLSMVLQSSPQLLAAPGPRYPHVRLVADSDVTVSRHTPPEGKLSLLTPTIFLTIGAVGTISAIGVAYAGASALFVAGGGMVVSAVGAALLVIAGVLLCAAIVFAVVGAVMLTKAIRQRQGLVEVRYALEPSPAPLWAEASAPSSALVLARF